jgi:glycosyltransferase involved in cell wall biosynthesis
MYFGVPVIATKVGGIPEVVGDAGILIPPKDPKAIEEAIWNLYINKEELLSLSKRGKRRVIEYFTPHVVIPQVEKIYEEVLLSG